MVIYIFHGAYGSPEENWIPWLKKELEIRGHQSIAPKFPTPEGQNLENWTNLIKEYEITADSILVGHSIACAFILNILEKRKSHAAFLVSPFISLLGNTVFDKINKTFLEREFMWNRIKENCEKFFLFHSDTDPYVPLRCAEAVSEKLSAKLKIVKGAGHFNENYGYKKFPELLEQIIKEA